MKKSFRTFDTKHRLVKRCKHPQVVYHTLRVEYKNLKIKDDKRQLTVSPSLTHELNPTQVSSYCRLLPVFNPTASYGSSLIDNT
ncbi:hypothetical protein RRG08_031840 [Elysia crispata]|uniref:Uncharacterized protein n=1 Tax=Elysia crispata TaxID=231223 RepID=A0AAE1CT85_9GAST|nr:hypothetical protein RRG08_031840 [Elysia crispata]